MPLLISIKNISIVSSGFFIVIANFSGYDPAYQLFLVAVGSALGIASLLLSIFVTMKADTRDLDDLIVFNNMIYWLTVGIILTIGSLFDDNIIIQLLILNIALIIGIFIIFMYIWVYLKRKWEFLSVENVDFNSPADKEKIPKFLLTSLLLGGVFSALFIVFQIIYNIFGYNVTSYSFLAVLFIFTLTISIILRYLVKE